MIKQLFLLCILGFSLSSFGQSVPGGHPGPGPEIGDDQLKISEYEKIEQKLLKGFSSSWQACGKGEVVFKSMKQLNDAILVDKITSAQPDAKPTCSPNCIFTHEVKKALKIFNKATWMEEYLVIEHEMSKEEAKAIVATMKTYEKS